MEFGPLGLLRIEKYRKNWECSSSADVRFAKCIPWMKDVLQAREGVGWGW